MLLTKKFAGIPLFPRQKSVWKILTNLSRKTILMNVELYIVFQEWTARKSLKGCRLVICILKLYHVLCVPQLSLFKRRIGSYFQEFGHKAAFYHGSIEPAQRALVQKQWSKDEINIICATVAFGMGTGFC